MNTPRLMTARYRGSCLMCADPVRPGDEIAQHAPKVTTHAGPCAAQLTAEGPEYIAEMAARTPARGGRRPRPSSASYGRFYGAGPRYRRRCEDAPCCGCCGTY